MDLKKELLDSVVNHKERKNKGNISSQMSSAVVKANSKNKDDVENELNALINNTKHEDEESEHACTTKQICRLCAQPIRGSQVSLYENSSLQKKVIVTLPIETKQGDGLPECICQNCEMNLNLFYEFVCRVTDADNIIRGKVNQNNLKSNDVTNDTIKQIFGDEDDDDEDANKLNEMKTDSLDKRKCLKEEKVDFSKLGDIENFIPNNKIKKTKKRVYHENGDKHPVKKISKVTKNISAQQQYKCHRCDEYFDDYNEVLLHSKRVHLQVEYHCPDCTKIFATERTLCKHIRDNHNAPVLCNICGKIFITSEALEKHQRKVHNVKVCYSCGASFKSTKLYNAHVLLHEDFDDYQCVFCSEYFANQNRLLKHTDQCHLRIHAGLGNKIESDDSF